MKKALLLTLTSLFCLSGHAQQTVEIALDTNSPGPVIHRNIYGQFMEHLGRGIYEGIWVGEDSEIPNTQGYRNDVLQALKELKVPLLRWPGGCFADEYHWRDGIGPQQERKVTINTTWGGVTDDNSFGTHEFMDLAELLGAEVYINANLGTGTPQEMAAWLEYLTAEGNSTLAQERRKNGRDKPWKVHYWAIGNESWGCGGHMKPAYYADLYRHYATFAKTPQDNKPIMIASGGHGSLTEWTETLIKEIPRNPGLRMDAISHHYYTLPTGDWGDKGAATNFPEAEWFSTLQQTLKIEGFIQKNIAILDQYDPNKEVGFYLDEWGMWVEVEEGENPGFLYQQNTLRDAIVAALNLNIFHQYAERVKMTNIAQMINVLQAMILTKQEQMLVTPTYHVFKMYQPFQDARSIKLTIANDPGYQFDDETVPSISASAAYDKSGRLWLALVNTNPNQPSQVKLSLPMAIKSAKGHLLTADSMDSHNTFSKPEQLMPVPYSQAFKTGEPSITLPAKALLVVELKP